MNCEDIVISWLNYAYNIEMAISSIYEMHLEEAIEVPQTEDILNEQLEKIQNKMERLADQIERSGRDIVKMNINLSEKELFSVQTDKKFGDKGVRNIAWDYSLTSFVVAIYRSIEEAANFCHQDETADMVSELAEVSTEMGTELLELFPGVVDHYISEQTHFEENFLENNF